MTTRSRHPNSILRHHSMRALFLAIVTVFSLGIFSGRALAQGTPTITFPGGVGPGGTILTVTLSGFGASPAFAFADVIALSSRFSVPLGGCMIYPSGGCTIQLAMPINAGVFSLEAQAGAIGSATTSNDWTTLQTMAAISPTCGRAGLTLVTVTGSNFPVNVPVPGNPGSFTNTIGIYWDQGATPLVQFSPDSSGTVPNNITFDVPSTGGTGRHNVYFIEGGGVVATKAFTVPSCVQIGAVTELVGTATENGTSSLNVGSPVFQDDTIAVTPGGHVIILFNDNTQLYLTGNPGLVLSDYVYNPNATPPQENIFFQFLGGAFRLISGQIGKDHQPENIETPFGSIGIRGTDFVLQPSTVPNSLELDLNSGTVDVTPNQGVLTEFTGPITIVFNATGTSTSPLTQDQYNTIVNNLFSSTTPTQTAPTTSFSAAPANASYGSMFTVTASTNASTVPSITATGPCSAAAVSGTAASAMTTITMTAGSGTCALKASWAADSKFLAASSVQSTSAQPATLTVTANNASRTYGQSNPIFTAKYSGFVNGDGQSAVSGSPSLTSAATMASLPGPYPIVAAAGTLTAANYSFQLVNGTLTVTFTAAAPASSTGCNGAYNGVFNGHLRVSEGQTCIFIGGSITRNVMSEGNLIISGAIVGGNVQIHEGTFSIGPSTTIMGDLWIEHLLSPANLSQICGTTVRGDLQLHDNEVAVQIGLGTAACMGNRIGGNLQITNNEALTEIFNNIVGGDLHVMNTTAATLVFNNDVAENLECHDNSSITGGGNIAEKKQGQCSTF